MAKPLFVERPHAAVRLDGVSIRLDRKAALVSIDGKPAEWLAQGQTRDGVTLTQVQSGRITIESGEGVKEVRLGERPAADAATGNPATGPVTPYLLRPPASAPSTQAFPPPPSFRPPAQSGGQTPR